MNNKDRFISKAVERYHGVYDYSQVVYLGCQINVTILCSKHGAFQRTPNEHLNGRHCATCVTEAGRIKRSEDFLRLAGQVHGDKYGYSRVEYVNNYTPVELNCPIHGEFKIKPDNHIQGAGCIQCGFQKSRETVVSNTENFVVKSVAKHGTLYDYSKANYTRNYVKVEIICPTHGPFFKTPSNHLMGQGCPDCKANGYRKGLPGSLYILHCDNYTKVGITNQGAKRRCKHINQNSGIEFQIICELKFQDGAIPQAIERQVLKYLRDTYQPVEEVFNGSTECFKNVNLSELIEFVTPLASPQNLNNQIVNLIYQRNK